MKDAGNFFHADVADVAHQAEGLLQFRHAVRWKRIMGISADGAVEMVGRDRVKSTAAGRHPPKTTRRRLGAGKFGDALRRRIQERNSDGAPCGAQDPLNFFFDCAIV